MALLTLTVNGEPRSADVKPGTTLLEFLHDYLAMTGTKCGCEEGTCGACTVHLEGRAIRSCMVTAESCAGKPVTTIEGLAAGNRLHAVQQAFLSFEAFQCGFCTPGMIMEAAALLNDRKPLTDGRVRLYMEGHVCRCGAYNDIVKAVMSAAAELRKDAGNE
ncbi:MAG: (2Fe-2S)-binding protein [Acidobacteria bacterium]|nr:(2Fe-2S)-binding protein [Acidobacteriota bacterium]